MKSILTAAKTTGVIPQHASVGAKGHASKDDSQLQEVLNGHFDYLLQLGEVQATRAVATLVNGAAGHNNREVADDEVYLPISMGYRNCYRRYMALLGYKVTCTPNGSIVIEGEGGKEVKNDEFVSFASYFSKWKKDYPQLKVNKPAEDICAYCFTFANRHRYLARHETHLSVEMMVRVQATVTTKQFVISTLYSQQLISMKRIWRRRWQRKRGRCCFLIPLSM